MKYKVLIVSIVLVVSLYLLSVPRFGPEVRTNERDKILINIKIITKVMELLHKDIGYYPTSKDGFEIIYINVNQDAGWNGPYLLEMIDSIDPWGNELIYLYPDSCNLKNKRFAVYSIGENGVDECKKGDDIFEFH